MRKTLPLMLAAFALVALSAAPSASACYATQQQVNYLVCDRGYASDTEDYATQTAGDALAFVTQEAADAAAFVLGVADDLLP